MPKDDQNKNSRKGKRLTEDAFAETPQEQILKTEYSELMQKSYIDYAMSVIVARALPDVREWVNIIPMETARSTTRWSSWRRISKKRSP